MLVAVTTEAPLDGTSLSTWSPGPFRPVLGPDAVDVWRVDLAGVPERLIEVLSSSERTRAERILDGPRRVRWARGRAILRALLGRYLDSDPRTLALLGDDGGRPALETATGADFGSRQLTFNLSHSGDTAVYALSSAGAVGIDVERPRRQIDVLAVAARAFDGTATARLRQLGTETREHEFLRLWVRHEASLKCLGVGIWSGADAGAGDAVGVRPWIAELDLGGRGLAALALERAPSEVRCWDWPIQAAR
jgi:4'-phosphopantetheinyl transferase